MPFSKVLNVKIHFPSTLKLNSQQVIVPGIMGKSYFSGECGAHAWRSPALPGLTQRARVWKASRVASSVTG